MKTKKIIEVYFDACSQKGRISSYGVLIILSPQEVISFSGRIDEGDSNKAEYTAMVSSLQWLLKNCKLEDIDNIYIHSDSLNLVKQMNGVARVKSDRVKDLYKTANELIQNIKQRGPYLKIKYLPRNLNKWVDLIARNQMENILEDEKKSGSVNEQKKRKRLIDT